LLKWVKAFQDEGLNKSEIECWAVCDDDNMPYSYKEPIEHAEQNNVQLAFSRPQFESYLLQHFEKSKTIKKNDLFSDLSKYKKHIDGEGYDRSAKMMCHSAPQRQPVRRPVGRRNLLKRVYY
jgi:hypothetical protein